MSSDIREIVNAQKRRRRLIFWAGFLLMALLGSLWAGLTKDARGPGFFEDEIFVGISEPGISEPGISEPIDGAA